ncbi:MAG: hypothetical protein ACTSUP_03320 [Candidatus Heimdallarchaeaceae archaeon]
MKKLVKSITDNTPGAVFVAKFSSDNCAYVWPAVFGIRKIEGCIKFGEAKSCGGFAYDLDFAGLALFLSNKESDFIYYDHCYKKEAWLVKPHGEYYLWERVDHKLELLIE